VFSGGRDDQILYCDMKPDSLLMSSFHERGDKQIMTLEVLSIALGVSTFASEIAGRNLVIWSDNTGAVAATRKGTVAHLVVCVCLPVLDLLMPAGATRGFDHNCLVHALWKRFAQLKLAVWVMRVPTSENIADDPSREDYCLLEKLGAVRSKPVLDNVFWHAQTWAALSLNE